MADHAYRTNSNNYASLSDMQDWAKHIICCRQPDRVIGPAEDLHDSHEHDYLRRWFIVPRNTFGNVYLHQFNRSDDDRAMHDHPWPSTSYLIEGEYLEHTPDGVFHRRAGDFVSREATQLHRIQLIGNEPVISLFTTGPKVRDWGFDCPKGWIPWEEFCAPGDSSQVGKGCGE